MTEAPEQEPTEAPEQEGADNEEESAATATVGTEDSESGFSGLAVGGIVIAVPAVLGVAAMAIRSRRRDGTVED